MQNTYCNHVVFFIIVPVHSCKLQEFSRCCCRVVTFLKYGPARPAEPSERRSCTTCPCPEDKYCHEASVLVANKPGSGVAYSTELVCALYACNIVYAKLVSDISGGLSACTKQCWRHSRALCRKMYRSPCQLSVGRVRSDITNPRTQLVTLICFALSARPSVSRSVSQSGYRTE